MTRNKLGKPISQRQLRVGEMIKQSLGMIFVRNEAKVPNLETNDITVTEVKMSQDLKIAKAFVLPLGGENAEEKIKLLKQFSFLIRKVLSKKITIKFLPKILFAKDESFEYAEKIENLITPKTTAILPVHIYGNPCNVKRIEEIADIYGLKVIYDAAHAFGVKLQNESVLNFGDLSVLSFHATKIFNTFEGGAIVCHDEKTKRRISKEYNDAMRVYGTVTDESYINSKFILPLDSFITSNFGKARVYNGSLKGYHSGTDFRAKIGTPIIASNDGVVALVKDRFYSGGTVLINHGQGIYTCYFHMSAFSVKVGQRVKKAQLLGLSGKSGRVTGPHLHFAVRINKVQVDPLQFIELMNRRIFTRKSRGYKR